VSLAALGAGRVRCLTGGGIRANLDGVQPQQEIGRRRP
jgi:hypothetical protein